MSGQMFYVVCYFSQPVVTFTCLWCYPSLLFTLLSQLQLVPIDFETSLPASTPFVYWPFCYVLFLCVCLFVHVFVLVPIDNQIMCVLSPYSAYYPANFVTLFMRKPISWNSNKQRFFPYWQKLEIQIKNPTQRQMRTSSDSISKYKKKFLSACMINWLTLCPCPHVKNHANIEIVKRQVMPLYNPYLGNFMNSGNPLQASASIHGGVHTIPSLQHHHQHQHHPKALQMHHYGSPYIPYLGPNGPGKALSLISDRGLMFRAILKATIKLYVELGIMLSMMVGTLWFVFGSAFTRLVQTALHGMGNAFLQLGSTFHSSKSWIEKNPIPSDSSAIIKHVFLLLFSGPRTDSRSEENHLHHDAMFSFPPINNNSHLLLFLDSDFGLISIPIGCVHLVVYSWTEIDCCSLYLFFSFSTEIHKHTYTHTWCQIAWPFFTSLSRSVQIWAHFIRPAPTATAEWFDLRMTMKTTKTRETENRLIGFPGRIHTLIQMYTYRIKNTSPTYKNKKTNQVMSSEWQR